MHVPQGFSTVFPYLFVEGAAPYISFAHSGESGHLIRFNAGSASGGSRAVQNQHL